MTSFFHRSTSFLVAGGAVLSSWAAMGANALALTEAQILEQLNTIPVFTITNQRGIPYVATIPSGTEDENPTVVTEVFISHEDAEASLDLLRETNPAFVADSQVTPVSLAKIYQVALMGREAENPLEFLFVPIVEEVEFALTLLPNQTNESAGVPLFMVSSETPSEDADVAVEDDVAADPESGDEISLLTLQQGGEEIVPLFFQREQFSGILDDIAEKQPDFAANLELRVIWLEDFIGILEKTDETDEDIQQYRMMPIQESLDFAGSFTPTAPEAPATAPTP